MGWDIVGSDSAAKFYVIHRHDAVRAGLHWDLRLEYNGVLKSWAIPKGMHSVNSKTRRLAIKVADHSMSYGDF